MKLDAFSKPETALLPIQWKGEPSDAEVVETYEHTLSDRDGERVFFGHYEAYFEGKFTVITRVTQARTCAARQSAPSAARPWLIEPFASGTTADHRPAAQSYFAPGADLATLADAGVRTDWNTASFLYAVVRRALRTLHDAKLVHGALSARRIRLRVGRDPYALDRRFYPVAFVLPDSPRPATRVAKLAELSIAARACARLVATTSPLPDTQAAQRALVRTGAAVDPLLRDSLFGIDEANDAALATLPESDVESSLLASFAQIDEPRTVRDIGKIDLDARIDSGDRNAVDARHASLHAALSQKPRPALLRSLFALFDAAISHSFDAGPKQR